MSLLNLLLKTYKQQIMDEMQFKRSVELQYKAKILLYGTSTFTCSISGQHI